MANTMDAAPRSPDHASSIHCRTLHRAGEIRLHAAAFPAHEHILRLPRGKIAGERPEQSVPRYKNRNEADPPQKQKIQRGDRGSRAKEMLIELIHTVAPEHKRGQPCTHIPLSFRPDNE